MLTVKFSVTGIWMLLFSLCLKMFIIVNKFVKALKPSKNWELDQAKRILKGSYRHLMLAFTTNAHRKLKADDKVYQKSSNVN